MDTTLMAATIAWTCVGVFVGTALVTMLALTRVIRLADKRYLRHLFAVLVVEVAVLGVGVATDALQSPAAAGRAVRDDAIRAFREHVERSAAPAAMREQVLRQLESFRPNAAQPPLGGRATRPPAAEKPTARRGAAATR